MFNKLAQSHSYLMTIRFRLTVLTLMCAAIAIVAVSFVSTTRSAAPQTGNTFYFHGTAQDEANKLLTFADATNRGTATWDSNPPIGTVPVTQQTHAAANADYVGNPLAASWRNSFSGVINGSIDLTLYLSTPNAETAVLGDSLEVSVFGDPEYVSGRVQVNHLIGRGEIPLSSVGPTPTAFTGSIPVNGTVGGELMIQIRPTASDTGAEMLVHYDSTTTSSSFTVSGLSPLPSPTPTPSVSPTPIPTGTPNTCSTTPSYSIHMSPADTETIGASHRLALTGKPSRFSTALRTAAR